MIAACESCAPEIMLVDLGEEELSVGLGKEGVDVVPLHELQAGLSHWLPIVGLGGRDVLAWVKERDESSLIGTVALPIQNPAFSQLVLRIISEKAICE